LRHRTATLALAALVLSAGCAAARRDDLAARLRSNHPRNQMEAIAEVVRTKDTRMIPELMALLDSEDSGLRFAAAGALHRLTGKDFGVYFADTDEERARRVEMWHRWWVEEGQAKYGGQQAAAPAT